MRKTVTFGVCLFLALAPLSGRADPLDGGQNPVLVKVKDLLQAKQAGQAVALLEAELKKQPLNAQFHYALGYAHELDKQPQKALEAFKQALRLKPTFPGLANRIKNLQASLGTDPDAIPDDPALTPAQNKARALFRKALKEKGNGNFDQAFEVFTECVDLDIAYLGGNDEGMIDAAITHYDAKVKFSKDPSAPLWQAIYRFFRGERETAERGLTTFLAGKPAPELAAVAEKWLKTVRHQQTTEETLTAAARAEELKKRLEEEKARAKAAAPAVLDKGAPPPASGGQVAPGASRVAGPAVSPAEEAEIALSSARAFAPSDEVTRTPRYKEAVAQVKDTDPRVAAAAAYRLGTFRVATPEALEGLSKALQNDDRTLVTTALEALGKIGPGAADAVPAVLEVTESELPGMKIQSLLCLGKIRSNAPVAVPAIVKCLKDENKLVEYNARDALMRYGKDAVPVLTESLSGADGPLKKAIQDILTAITGG
ncbi:MAG: tetratricopeptide repeat protein [Candidatus Riflebacteria bacterium]|nr:tetratricopeptide repeat protein [Candidatus Riflebacteria bacterium]